jgi:hypothetical protein
VEFEAKVIQEIFLREQIIANVKQWQRGDYT